MRHIRVVLERVFVVGHAILVRLSDHWKEHTNRRTIIIILVVGICTTSAYLFGIRPPDGFPVDSLVSVPDGSSLRQVAEKLQADGVVRSSLLFRVLVTVMGDAKKIRAGDYVFKQPRDIFGIAYALSIGAFGLEPIKIRIPEGMMTKEMASIFEKRFERFDAQNFLTETQPEEGYFFPDTYFFMPNATEYTIAQAMRQNFDEHLATIAPEIASSTHSLPEIVTMASIIEREARNPQDRRLIAGVLWNRLARGMPLQVDVTFLYTIGKGTFQLTTKDLVSDSPYNTYKNKGLPPTPIGSPSLDSLLAAAAPTKNNFLFYLADNTGVTHFSRTYEEHLQKKRLYLGS